MAQTIITPNTVQDRGGPNEGDSPEQGDSWPQVAAKINAMMTELYAAGTGGLAGPAGPAGPQGATGATGAQGVQGVQGIQGSTGPQGPAGATGPAGTNGATGPQGPAGPAGPTGPQGPPGSGGGSSSIAVSDGTHNVTGVTQINVSGATVSGTTPTATITVPAPPAALTLTDGTNTIAAVDHVAITGAVVGGTSPNATLAIPASVGSGPTVNAGDSSFGDFATSPRATIQAAVDYCYANNIADLYIPAAPGSVITPDGPIYFDPPANMRSGVSLANQKLAVFATPSVFTYGLNVVCAYGAKFKQTWQTSPCFVLGPNEQTRVKGATVIGPRNDLGVNSRQLDPRCTAFAIASGNGGASDTVLEDCVAYDVYCGATYGQNGQNALADNNVIRNCRFSGAKAIEWQNGQSLTNRVEGGNHTGSLTVFSQLTAQGALIIGGEHAPMSLGGGATLAISSITGLSALTDYLPGGTAFTNYTFNITLSGGNTLPQCLDGSFLYNVMMLLLPSFGYVPCRQTAWDGTSVATFKIDLGWLFFHFGEEVALTSTHFATELAAATSFYVASRATVCNGGVTMMRSHIETNSNVALYESNANTSRGVFIDLDLLNWHPGFNDESTLVGVFNRIFPWAKQTVGDLIFDNCNLPSDVTGVFPPVLIQCFDYPDNVSFSRFQVRGGTGLSNVNIRYVGDATASTGGAPRSRGPGYDDGLSSQPQLGTKAFGGCIETERSLWAPNTGAPNASDLARMTGTQRVPFIGYRPDPGFAPKLTAAGISALSTLTGTIPYLCGGRMYNVTPPSAGALASHVVDVGGTGISRYATLNINWSFNGQSQFISVTSGTDNINNVLFNGQELILSHASINSGTPFPVIVTGCFLGDGYISVYRASATASVLPGTAGTNYTGTTIASRAPVLSFPGQTRTSLLSTQFDKTSSTALANISDLTQNYVFAGLSYHFRAILSTTSNSSGGVQAAISGTATASGVIYEASVADAGVDLAIGTARATALGTKVGDVTAVSNATITIAGSITVATSGTLGVQFAQNASNGTASSVLSGSYFEITEIVGTVNAAAPPGAVAYLAEDNTTPYYAEDNVTPYTTEA